MSAYTEADVERLATVIHDARVGGISYGNYTLARWILDRWPVEETGRRWVFSLDSKPDVVMADGVHRYWSTHCRHGHHDLCKGTCKGCGSTCICGCPHPPVEGSTPIASPARVGICGAVAPLLMNGVWTKHCTLPHGHDGWHQDDGEPPMMWSVDGGSFAQQSTMPPAAAPAGEVVSVPPPAPACCVDAEQGPADDGTLLHTLGCANRCGVATTWYRPGAPLHGWPYPCASTVGHEGDHWAPPPLRTPLVGDEPVPVPPPIDALLKLIFDVAACEDCLRSSVLDEGEKREIIDHARALWAAGVEEGHGLLDRAVIQEIEQRERAEEIADKLTAAIGRHLGEDFGEHSNLNDPWGRALVALAEADAGGKFVGGAYERGIFDEGIREGHRQRDAEIHANVFTSARLAAAEAGFAPAPESVTVTYDMATDPIASAFANGVTEGRLAAEAEFDDSSAYELAALVHRYLHVEAPDNSDPVRVAIEVLEEAIQDHGTAGSLESRGVAEGRRQATEDLTAWLDQLAARLPQYNSELSVCTRRANAQVLGAYERAATIARSGLDRNPHCSTCGDTRGGPRGHETSECTWDMWRWPDLLAVPRDAPATEVSAEERCDLPGEHEPHDYDVDAPAGEWRHCDGAAATEATHG